MSDLPDEKPTPELHRPLALERIPPHGFKMIVTATPAECAALAARLRIPAVRSMTCRFQLNNLPRGNVAAEGELRARVVQTCIVSLDDFAIDIVEPFSIRFVPAGTESEEDLLSTDPESDDEVPYEGVFLDLGEAASEQLALALDPYPRKPGAELPEAATDLDVSPFAALAPLAASKRKN
jgi:hypothetical protein